MYVVDDGRVSPCRAADPEHCRYHVGMKHYTSRGEADRVLEQQIRAGVMKRNNGLNKSDESSNVLTSAKLNAAMKDGRKLLDLYLCRYDKL